jgi:hypothetical protein
VGINYFETYKKYPEKAIEDVADAAATQFCTLTVASIKTKLKLQLLLYRNTIFIQGRVS